MDGRAERPDPRVLVALVLAMAGASALILWAGRGTSLIGDELYYYGRLVERAGEHVPYSFGIEYLLAPHNGHLQLTGKLVYEAIFGTVGTNYLVLRVVELIGMLLFVALVFELVRRRVGAVAALAAAVLLLFLGAAWEVMIWPFDLHTAYACAAGLGALLALERGGRCADPIACALLVVSVATIEVGLALVAAAAVLILWHEGRLRRAWVFAVPVVLYLGWSLWAHRFEQGDFVFSNLLSLPGSLAESAAATLGPMAGRIDAGATLFPAALGIDGWGVALAGIAVAALALRLSRGRISPSLVALLAALLVYWSFIALADRPPDSSRYILVGAALVILITAEALRGARVRPIAAVALFVLVAVAVPPNIATLFDGRAYQVAEAEAARAHFGIIELARDRGLAEAEVARTGGGLVAFGVAPGTYLDAAERVGSIGFSLERIRSESQRVRAAADRSLALLVGMEFGAAEAPTDPGDCRSIGGEGRPVAFELPPTGGLLRAQAGTGVGLGRLTTGLPSVQLGEIPDRGWRRLKIRPDPLSGQWRLYSTAGLRFCEP